MVLFFGFVQCVQGVVQLRDEIGSASDVRILVQRALHLLLIDILVGVNVAKEILVEGAGLGVCLSDLLQKIADRMPDRREGPDVLHFQQLRLQAREIFTIGRFTLRTEIQMRIETNSSSPLTFH